MRICLSCGESLEDRRPQTKYCNRKCYRRSLEIKRRYAERTRIFQNAHARELPRRYQKLRYKCIHDKLEFSLTLETYMALLCSPCYYCGTSLHNETGCGLDRKEPKLGYVAINVLPCCGKCNQIRNVHLTVDEMQVAMQAVVNYRLGIL